MIQNIETQSLDLRFEKCRLKNKFKERELCLSILENGVREPLIGIDTKDNRHILLDGFKRLRCAVKNNINIVPYISIASEASSGIINFIKISNANSLNILEQARLIDELIGVYKMGIGEIASCLERSSAWVSVRKGILAEMSEVLKEEIFAGRFPARCYFYTLQQFTRVKSCSKEEVDKFVKSVSGKNLKTRDIDLLAYSYFKGGECQKHEIENGNILFCLEKMKEIKNEKTENDLNETEKKFISDLEIIGKYICKFIQKRTDRRFQSELFFKNARILVEGIISKTELFTKSLKEFYDKSRQDFGDNGTSP